MCIIGSSKEGRKGGSLQKVWSGENKNTSIAGKFLSPSGIRHAIDRAPLRSAASVGLGQISFGADYDCGVAALQDTIESNRRRLLVIVDGDNCSIPQHRFDVSFRDCYYHMARH